MNPALSLLERFVETVDSAYYENEFNIDELIELAKEARAMLPKKEVEETVRAVESPAQVRMVCNNGGF